MGHKDDGKPSFGPGHDGWWCVVPSNHPKGWPNNFVADDTLRLIFKKAKSAFSAAQQAGFNLTQVAVRPITKDNHPDVLEALEKNQLRKGWEL